MDRDGADEQIGTVLMDLMRARRILDAQTFDELIGSILIDVDVGMQVAEEMALEAKFRRRDGNVIPFPPPDCRRPR